MGFIHSLAGYLTGSWSLSGPGLGAENSGDKQSLLWGPSVSRGRRFRLSTAPGMHRSKMQWLKPISVTFHSSVDWQLSPGVSRGLRPHSRWGRGHPKPDWTRCVRETVLSGDWLLMSGAEPGPWAAASAHTWPGLLEAQRLSLKRGLARGSGGSCEASNDAAPEFRGHHAHSSNNDNIPVP